MEGVPASLNLAIWNLILKNGLMDGRLIAGSIRRLHAAGISSILHTYAFFIDKNTKYVTPVPSEDLGYFNSFTLARPVSMNDTQIVVNETTANLSMTTGFFVRNSVTLRIGNELIEYTGITNSPPYTFTGCKRGVNGTQASFHQSNEKVFHLKEMFGRFVPGPETQLFRDIATNTAEIVSDCGFDGLYFDAIDGSDILDGEENTWYYGTKFILEVARNLKTPVGMEMSSMSHLWWHYRSRWQAWDRPIRGYKRFIDIHSAAIKLKEYEHGLWSGYSPMIDKYACHGKWRASFASSFWLVEFSDPGILRRENLHFPMTLNTCAAK